MVRDELWSRIYASNAAGAIANSMGDITEHLTWEQIEERYGFLDQLLPQSKKEWRRANDWGPDAGGQAHERPAGMTEDGHERHRLMCEAIIEKGGRVGVEDLARTWLRLIDPTKFGYLLGWQDQVIYYAIRGGVHPALAGQHSAFPGFIGTAKMILPIGYLNAGDPLQAARDARDVGRLKDAVGRPGNYGIEVAAAVAAGVARAMSRDATLGGVIDAVLQQLPKTAKTKLQSALDEARTTGDWKKLRPVYQQRYAGQSMSEAMEVLCGAMALLYLADADVEQTLLTAVNFGRDCDCRAYVAAGLAGALSGPAGLRKQWIQTIDDELPADPYTVSRRGLTETADGLRAALENELRKLRDRIVSLGAGANSQIA